MPTFSRIFSKTKAGNKTKTFPDGREVVKFANGTYREEVEGGRTLTKFSNGASAEETPDNRLILTHPDGTVEEFGSDHRGRANVVLVRALCGLDDKPDPTSDYHSYLELLRADTEAAQERAFQPFL